MHKILNIKFLLLFLIFSLGLNAQITLVPDPIFENYLETHDASGLVVPIGSPTAMGDGIAGNGKVLTANIEGVTNLSLNNLAISDFTGLEDFIELEEFLQTSNFSTENFNIDFSSNTQLTEISIVNAPSLISVDVSQNVLLDRLQVATQGNLFTEIDVSNNINLTKLEVWGNALTNVDTQNNPLLNFLAIRSNPITSIDVSHLNALEFFVAFDTQITFLDLSSNSNLSLLLAENGALESLNLQNGANNLITYMDIRGNSPNGVCVLVDDVSFAEAQTNWFKDISSNYYDDYCIQNVTNLEIDYDGFGNVEEVNDWLDNNAGAVASEDYTWSYKVLPDDSDSLSDTDFDGVLDRLTVTVRFTAENGLGGSLAFNADIIFNNFATAGESNGNGGAICDDEYSVSQFDDSLFSEPNGGAEYNESRFGSSTFSINEISGVPGLELEGSDVKFPNTGSGQFTYFFQFNVSTSFNIGSEERTYETSTFYTANLVTVAFDPGPNKTITVCDFNNLSLTWLYEQLDIQVGIDTSEFNEAFDNGNEFNPENFWYNENDDLEDGSNPSSLAAITGPGVYQFNAKNFLEDCAGEPVYVTLVQENSETYIIPDQQFEQALIDLNIDTDQTLNGQIQTCEISNIEYLSIENYAISSFEGLQYFTGLRSFYLANNQTPTFHTIDFSGNPLLEYITVDDAPRLFNVNVIQNNALIEANIRTGAGSFDGVDFTGNINLIALNLSGNIGLTNIQFAFNSNLQTLNLTNTSAFNVNLSNFPNLRTLFMSGISSLSTIDLSQNNQITDLYFDNSGLDEIDLSNLSQLGYLRINNTDIKLLDVSNNPVLSYLAADNNQELEIANLKNGYNNSMLVFLANSPNLLCVLVDDEVYSENASSWYEDDISIYTDDSICGKDAIDKTVSFDGVGNQDDVLAWINSNGNAIVYSPEELIWDYTFNSITQIDNLIEYNTTFTGVGSSVNFSTDAIFTINTGNFDAGDDFAPVAGDVANGVEAEGSLCDYESYDLSLFKDTSEFDSGVFENSTNGYVQRLDIGSGIPVTNIDGTEVDFPNTGSGQFSYYYTFSVSKEVQLFGMTEPITVSDEASVWHWLTIPFDPGEDKSFEVCTTDNITLDDLYAQFDIVDGTDDVSFDPNDYWFDTNGSPITTYNGPGEYVFNAGGFLPECGAKPASVVVTLIEEVPLSAGLDGELGICSGETPTEADLFEALEGSADIGGTWQEIATGIYEYSHAATSCTPEVTATVTLTEEVPLSAGLDGELGICSGETPTEAELFGALEGSADAGGTWQEISTGVYQYSHAATSCNPESTAIVTLTEEIPLSAGLDGELGICSGETPTEAELFNALEGSADTGGTWQEISTGIYEYSHAATSCNPASTAIVTLIEEVPLSAGLDGELGICSGETPTEADLFEALEGSADIGGTWQEIATGIYEYSHAATSCTPEVTATVTLTEEVPLSAGLDGNLGVCPGEVPTDEQLFGALQGSADAGGTWQEISMGVYQYSHAATSCNPESTAIVTLTEEVPLSAGLDGELGICAGDVPTDEQLFGALQGSADSGGTWQEISMGVYQYSHAATSCNPESTAIVTLTEEVPLSAGLDGELGICAGDVPTDEQLFGALQGSADSGGTWQEISMGVYQYSHAATSCNPESTAIVTLTEEVPLSAGLDGELGICAGDVPTDEQLFGALQGSADSGGTWQEISTGVYQYSHAATSCNPESTATVTLTEEIPLSAGLDGELSICSGEVPTDDELFMALEGSADAGGTWQEISTGVYQYSHAATSCSPESTAIVTITEEVELSAGSDGELEVCPGSNPTFNELFDALGGNPNIGGTWVLIQLGVFQYTHFANNCYPQVSAIVTLIEEVPLSAGESAIITKCEDEVPTEEELFNALGGNPDEGGTWLEIEPNLFEYSHSGSQCFSSITATVSIDVIEILSAGDDAELDIEAGTLLTDSILFNALEGNPDEGGVWSPEPLGGGTYTYTHSNGTCLDTSSTVEVREVNLIPNNIQLENLEIFPNPSNGIIRLSNEENIRIYSIEIIAITGQNVSKFISDFNFMDISDLEASIYFVKINSAAGVKAIKLILK